MRDPVGPEREPANVRLPSSDRMPARDRERPVVHDHLARSTPTVRIVARDRWPVAWAGLIGLFLVGALIKPWVGPALAPPSFGPAAAEPATLAPSVGPDLLAGLRVHCQEPIGWRVYSREMWIGRSVRTWRSVEPVAGSSGPADPAIPIVPLGPFVDALGYCSPWTGPERPPDDAQIMAWRWNDAARGGDGLALLPLETIAPRDPTVLGALFAAARAPRSGAAPGSDPTATPGPAGWPAGRYVFVLRATDWERWWAVQVATPDRQVPSEPPPDGDEPPPDGAPPMDPVATSAAGSGSS